MGFILNIDTSLDTASVCLAKEGNVLEIAINDNFKDHASWLHVATKNILQKIGFNLNECQAVAVSIGPGSYTGLRVGLASAKGICYALNIPLITISTLKMIALAAAEDIKGYDIICPVIDARRMELFIASYTTSLTELSTPQALIIDENSFSAMLKINKVLFCGNGIKKLQKILKSPNAVFSDKVADVSHIARLSYNCFQNKEFSNLAYADPLYIKEFYFPPTSVS